MAVYLNQAQRSLQHVNVPTRGNSTIPFILPGGYSPNASYIGGGAYGLVVRTYAKTSHMGHNGDRLEVAIKKIQRAMNQPKLAQRSYRELILLQRLDHPNIARLLDVYTTARKAEDLTDMFLVMEYVGSSLDTHLDESRKNKQASLPMTIIPYIIRDTLRALDYLKRAHVLHRDLKPSNLAINSSGRTVLIDFGLARTGRPVENPDSPLTRGACTVAYAAPEVIFWAGGSYDREADMWSLGCIIAELYTWEALYTDPRSQVTRYITMFEPIPESFLSRVSNKDRTREYLEEMNATIQCGNWEEYFTTKNNHTKVANFANPKDEAGLDLFVKCMQYEPESRITIKDAFQHPFIKDISSPEDSSHVQPLKYNDAERTIEEWQSTIFEEILNFGAPANIPCPVRH